MVALGQYVSVDPGPLFLIKKISYVSNRLTMIPNASNCQLYLGINRTRAKGVFGHLRPGSWDELHVRLFMNKRFMIGHSSFDCVCFSGFKYFPHGHLEPPSSELSVIAPRRGISRVERQWTLPTELTMKFISTF